MYVATYTKFEVGTVLLSFALSFLGCYMAIGMSEQLRNSLIEEKRIFGPNVTISHKKKHLFYLLLMSLSLGGVSVWSMHFIGMNASHVHDEQGERVYMRYSITLVVFTLLFAWFMSFVGLTIACYDPMFSKSKAQIVEEFIEDSKRLTLQEVRKITPMKMLVIISTKKWGQLVTGGVIMGAGVCVAHFLGMEAAVFDGQIDFNPGLVFFAAFIAIFASVLAFWILFRLLSVFPDKEWLRLLAALIMATAVCAMNYTGMEATEYRFSSNASEKHDIALNNWDTALATIYSGAIVCGNVFLWGLVIFTTWHARCTIARYMKLVRQADIVIQKLAAESASILSHSTHTTATEKPLSSANPSLNPSMVRQLTEQYLSKRVRSYEQRLEMTSETRGLISEVNHQLQMGFAEFLAHIVLLLLTGQWNRALVLFRTEGGSSIASDSIHNSSAHNSEHPVDDEAGLVSAVSGGVVALGEHTAPVPVPRVNANSGLKSFRMNLDRCLEMSSSRPSIRRTAAAIAAGGSITTAASNSSTDDLTRLQILSVSQDSAESIALYPLSPAIAPIYHESEEKEHMDASLDIV